MRFEGDDDAHAARASELSRTLESLRSRAGASRAVLWAIEPAAMARPISVAGGAEPPARGLAGDPLEWAWRESLPMRLERPVGWPDAAAEVQVLPVLTGDRGGAVLTLELPEPGLAHDLRPLQDQAEYLGTLLRIQHRERAAESAQRRYQELMAALKRLGRELDPAALGADLADLTLRLTGATGAAVAVWRQTEGAVLAVAGHDGGPRPGQAIGLRESEAALAAHAAVPILRERRDRGSLPVVARDEVWGVQPRSAVAVPLRSLDGGAVGVLAGWSRVEAGIGAAELEVLEVLAPYAALQLANALSFGSLREMAERDALTGLHNRRGFDERLEDERKRFERYRRPVSLILFDADRFKSLNDSYGHEAGDEALRTLGRLLQAALREADVAARFGGEELAVLLPETGLDAALDVAERVRRSVEDAGVAWQGQQIPLTVSAGVAACPEPVPDFQALIAAADAALYAAKEAGRNRVARAARPTPAGG